MTAGSEAIPPLSKATPSRWKEAKRRAGLIREYAALSEPTAADMADFADKVGVGLVRFRLLVRTFAQSDANPKQRRARHHNSVDPATEQEIAAALDRIGTDVLQEDLHAIVVAACTRRGVPPPSFATVRRRLVDAKAGIFRPTEPSGSIVLDRVSLGVLVERDGVPLRPMLVAALDERSGDVRAWDVDAGASRDLQGARTLVAAGIAGTLQEAAEMARTPERWAGSGGRPLASRLGPRIGRVPVIGPEGSVPPVGPLTTVVELEDLRSVVDWALREDEDRSRKKR